MHSPESTPHSESAEQQRSPEVPTPLPFEEVATIHEALDLIFNTEASIAVSSLSAMIRKAQEEGSIERVIAAAVGHRRVLQQRILAEQRQHEQTRLELEAVNAEKARIEAEKAQLEQALMVDPKTNLGSWRAFERQANALEKLMNGTERAGEIAPRLVVAVSTDVIGLKATNDTIGNEAGDDRLILCADALRHTFRDGDFYRLNSERSDELVGMIPIYGDNREDAAHRLEIVIDRLKHEVPQTYLQLLEEMRGNALATGTKKYLETFPDDIPLRAAFTIYEPLEDVDAKGPIFSYDSIGLAVKAAEPKIVAAKNPDFMIHFASPSANS